MSRLMVFTVVHHTRWHETTTQVVAATKWDASKAVDGEVMHVSEGQDIYEGKVIGSSSWSKDFMSPGYPKVSEEWRQYLLKRHFNSGAEDRCA